MIYSPNKTIYGDFKMWEVAKSPTADRLQIDNTPPDFVLERAELVAMHILQPVRDHFGIPFSPNSWYRCEQLEREITRKSFAHWVQQHKLQGRNPEDAWAMYFALKSHPKGEAVDFELPGVSNLTLYNWCQYNLPEFDQLIAEFMKRDDLTAGWVHASYTIGHNRKQAFDIS